MKIAARILAASLSLFMAMLMALPLMAQTAPAAKPAQKPAVPANTASDKAPAASGKVAPVTTYDQIKTPKLPEFHPQTAKRIVLSNGMVVFLQEDHELPLIDGFVRIRGGAREVPAAKLGLIGIYANSWRTGGTHNQTGDQLDDYLEVRAAKVEATGDIDSTGLSFSALKADFNDVFRVFVDVLRNPEFRQEKIDLAKEQANTSISRRNEDVESVAEREANKIGYGADNPYARTPEYWTVAAITRKDLVDWHREHVSPGNIILGIVGDFDSAEMETKLRAAFSDWSSGAKMQPTSISVSSPKPGIYFASKEDVNQSQIQIVASGIRRDDPDFFAVRVMNEVLSGGFSMRLIKELRTRQGLAYSVDGGIETGWDHPGLLRLTMGTKSESTVKAVEGLKHEMARLLKEPPTEKEIKQAKDQILNSFIFRFDSKEKILEEDMLYEFYGFPLDYLSHYRANVEKVSAADVARAAKRLVDVDKFAVLVVGNSKDFDPPLTSLGPVTNVDISIPTDNPTGKQAAVTPTASNDAGKALIAKVVSALGGNDKLSGMKSYTVESSGIAKTPQGDMNISAKTILQLPDSASTQMTMDMGEMTMVFTPNSAFMSMGGQSQDFPEDMRRDAVRDMRHDMYWIAKNASNPQYIFVAGGTEKAGDKEAVVLTIIGDDIETKWLVDPQTGLVLRTAFRATTMRGPVARESDLTDYRDVDGVKFAFKRVTRENGQVSGTSDLSKVVVNPAIDPKIFQKP